MIKINMCTIFILQLCVFIFLISKSLLDFIINCRITIEVRSAAVAIDVTLFITNCLKGLKSVKILESMAGLLLSLNFDISNRPCTIHYTIVHTAVQ